MSFRKRNVGLSGPAWRVPPRASPEPTVPAEGREAPVNPGIANAPGVRSSPVDARPTTSTGASSLDGILAGHAGLALGSSILIEEAGTTDYGTTLLRYYAAEGVVQGHRVHAIGVPEQWGRELPGLVDPTDQKEYGKKAPDSERMKIAYRYERLGQFGTGASRETSFSSAEAVKPSTSPFCRGFDLTKRLLAPSTIRTIPLTTGGPEASPWAPAIRAISHELESTPPTVIHRIVVPSLLSPVLYPPWASSPRHVLQFLHSLRALLRRHASRLTAMLSLPLALHERQSGLTRWMELLCDGIIELIPFAHELDPGPSLAGAPTGAATAHEDQPQGLVKVHRLPVFHERGGGGGSAAAVDDDLAFTLSRRRFRIQPFRLPPMEGDASAQSGEGKNATSKSDLEF